MSNDALEKAVELAGRLGHLFVATADADGLPHVASAADVALVDDHHVAVGAWFCPGTVANLDGNRQVALVAWDPVADVGYQLMGEVERVDEIAVLDGYLPEAEGAEPPPQIERRLRVRVDTLLHFTHAPHSDVPESSHTVDR